MNEYLQTEREIKGYVDIQYSDICNNSNQAYDYPEVAPISFPNNITSSNSNKVAKNYASLENNYFLLDGSFVLPDYNYSTESGAYGNTDSGYIANEISNSYSFYQLFERNNSVVTHNITNMRGLTIYFKDNIPHNINIKITIYDTEQEINFNISDNEKTVIQFNFENDYLVKRIDYEFFDMEYSNRRLRIPYIEYGLGDILSQDNGNLISFNIIENIGELNLEFPSNECTITLYDEEDKFDINNPSGYADLLNKNVKIKPYIGILTQENGIQYILKGAFHLSTWNNEKNKITLNAIDYLDLLKNTKSYERLYSVANSGNLEVYYALSNLQEKLNNEYNINISGLENLATGRFGTEYFVDTYINSINVFDYLQQLVVWASSNLYCTYDSNGEYDIKIAYTGGIYNNKLMLNTSLLEEPKYSLKEKLKSVTIVKYTTENETSLSPTKLIKEISFDSNGLMFVELEKVMRTSVIYYDSNNNEDAAMGFLTNIIPINMYENYSVKIYQDSEIELINDIVTKEYNNEGIEITIDNKFFRPYISTGTFAATLDERCEEILNNIVDNYKKYNVSINYIGDPNIKPNMIVPIETQYGEKQVKVLKHTLTFNGGLTGTIEGVGD